VAKNHLAFTFALAPDSGPYGERQIVPDEVDLRLTLSRNDRPQPFHLICQHDSVLLTMSGEGRVAFAGSSVSHHDYALGDVIYVPAGTPHRILPASVSVHHRFKLPESEFEGVAWYCEGCGAEIHRDVWALAEELPQEGYLRACRGFNADAALRSCGACGAVHPSLELEGFRWEEIASERRAAASQP